MSASVAYLRSKDVAERLDVTVHTVLSWIKSGELSASDVSARRGGRPSWRISESDLEVFLVGRSPSPPVPQQRRRRSSSSPKQYV